MRLSIPVLVLGLGVLAVAQVAASGPPVARRTAAPAIIVQGGLDPGVPCGDQATGTFTDGVGRPDPVARVAGTKAQTTGTYSDGSSALAIGPKQDDPAPPPQARKGGYDLAVGKGAREAASGAASGRGVVAIGPKQDDPAPPPKDAVAKCGPATR